MKWLPFERRLRLESEPCVRCSGTGTTPRPAPNLPPMCWYCRGTGRKFTKAARDLYDEICGVVDAARFYKRSDSRLDPRRIEHVLGEDVQEGMKVALPSTPPTVVDRVEPGPMDRLIVLADGSRHRVGHLDLLKRELTEDETADIEIILAHNLGKGAVDSSSLETDARARAQG